MPELPEVEVVKRSLEKKVLNSVITKVKINDGSDNVELFQINISSNAITSTMSVTGTISETDPQAAALAIALG